MHTLVGEVLVDILVAFICQVLFGPDYAGHVSTARCDYPLRLVYDRHTIKDI